MQPTDKEISRARREILTIAAGLAAFAGGAWLMGAIIQAL